MCEYFMCLLYDITLYDHDSIGEGQSGMNGKVLLSASLVNSTYNHLVSPY